MHPNPSVKKQKRVLQPSMRHWVDQDCEFYNRSMMLRLYDNNTEMYSRHNQKSRLLLKDLSEP